MKYKSARSTKAAVMAALPFGVLFSVGCSTIQEATFPADYDQRFYVGAGLLGSDLDPDTSEAEGFAIDEGTSDGASLTAGMDLSQNISVEAHLADLGEATLTPSGSVAYQVAGITGLYYALNRPKDRLERLGLSVYGRAGLGFMDNSAKVVEYERVNSEHFVLGAGAEYGFENSLAVRAEVVAHESDARYVQLGLVYRFGDYDSAIEPTVTAGPGSSTAQDRQIVVSPVESAQDTVTVQPSEVGIASVNDTDLDGVANALDRCPGTGGGLPVDDQGCEIFNGVIEGVNFETGSDTLTDEAVSVLAGIAQTLRDYPDIKITIEAHTDNRGPAVENMQLSRRRAITVARFLVDQGIAGSRLKPRAFGESRPRVNNSTEEGRAANRRVEFSVVE